MSIYASWPEIGEYGEDYSDSGKPDGTVLSYMRGHAYPDPCAHRPGSVGVAHIPGFIWRSAWSRDYWMRRREQPEDDPVAPFLRLDVSEWDEDEGMPMVTGTVVLTPPAVERLRDQLTEWLGRPRHEQ